MDPTFLIIFALAIGLLIFMSTRNKKRMAQQSAFRESLTPGQEVMTASGLFGVVSSIDGDRVTLVSPSGHETVWLKLAIGKLVEPEEAPAPIEDDVADTSGSTIGANDVSTDPALPTDLGPDGRPRSS